jgi:hypothetical protein
MRFRTVICVLSVLYVLILISSTLVWSKFGFSTDACFHVDYTHQLLGLPPLPPTIERPNGYFCEVYVPSPSYPDGFHVFASGILSLVKSDYLTFIVIIPLIIMLFPLGTIEVLKEIYGNYEISVLSMFGGFFYTFYKWNTNSVSFTRFFVLVLLVWAFYLFIRALKSKSKKRFLLFIPIFIFVLATPFIHRIPNPSTLSTIDKAGLGVYSNFLIPFFVGLALWYSARKYPQLYTRFKIILPIFFIMVMFLFVTQLVFSVL